MAKFLDFETEAPNKAEMVNNYDWMKDFTFLDFARTVGKHITVNYMMAKESVQKRLKEKPKTDFHSRNLPISFCKVMIFSISTKTKG